MADRKLLRELTEAFGPSGFETESANIVARELAGADEVSRDGLGSVVCRVAGRSERPRIMVSAHMDEVGFLVKSITVDGYVKFLPIGGWSPNVLLGQRVLVRTRKGDFPGVIGSKPPHELTEEATPARFTSTVRACPRSPSAGRPATSTPTPASFPPQTTTRP